MLIIIIISSSSIHVTLLVRELSCSPITFPYEKYLNPFFSSYTAGLESTLLLLLVCLHFYFYLLQASWESTHLEASFQPNQSTTWCDLQVTHPKGVRWTAWNPLLLKTVASQPDTLPQKLLSTASNSALHKDSFLKWNFVLGSLPN